MSSISRIFLIFALFMIASDFLSSAQNLYAIPCPNLRPQICTADVTPVCAYRNIQCVTLPCNNYETISSSCTACTDPSILGYTNGACVCTPYRSSTNSNL